MSKWIAAFAMALALLPCHASAQASSGVPNVVFANGTISGLNANVTLLLSGQTLCRANLNSASGFVGTIQVQLQSLGDSSWVAVQVYSDSGNMLGVVPPQIGLSGNGNWTVYPRSAGAIRLIATAYTNGLIQGGIACTPASIPF